ncbi:MAG: CHASE2 domain-containing protein, partial [Dongiaceae bacterium]
MSLNRASQSLRRYGPQIRQWLARTAICLAIAALYLFGALDFIERQLTSVRFQLLKSEPSGAMVVVAIDAPSLQQMPVWPWPRSWHAMVLDRLSAADADSIAIDIDLSSASVAVEDAALSAALARAGERAILPVFQQRLASSLGDLLATGPLPDFARHTRIASANLRPDSDGIVRRMARFESWSGVLVPTVASAAAGLQSGDTDRYFVDFGIRAERIPTVSYVDVLRGTIDPAIFAGKTVLIGATAAELGGMVTTPVGGVMPGVMVQA